jgi:hypothetical protein
MMFLSVQEMLCSHGGKDQNGVVVGRDLHGVTSQNNIVILDMPVSP